MAKFIDFLLQLEFLIKLRIIFETKTNFPLKLNLNKDFPYFLFVYKVAGLDK